MLGLIDITIYQIPLSRMYGYARMRYMEIAILPKNAVKIKGKTTAFVLESSEAPKEYSAALYFTANPARNTLYDNGINIDRPGEYEVGGVKISGKRYGGDTAFSTTIDGISVFFGKLSTMEKFHGKMQEHDVLLIQADQEIDPSFTSALATNAILFFGEYASAIEKNFIKDGAEKMSKFTSTKEKLPQEMVTILLQ